MVTISEKNKFFNKKIEINIIKLEIIILIKFIFNFLSKSICPLRLNMMKRKKTLNQDAIAVAKAMPNSLYEPIKIREIIILIKTHKSVI